MPPNGIPGVEPLGPSHETLRFFIGIAIYILALGGLVVYLVYKLPREDEEEGPDLDASGPMAGQDQEAAREDPEDR